MRDTRVRRTQHVGRVSKIEDGLRLLREKGKDRAGSNISPRLTTPGKARETSRTKPPTKRSTERRSTERAPKKTPQGTVKGRYEKRYVVAAGLLVLGILMFVLVASVLRPGVGERQSPIEAAAKPGTALAMANGVRISSPIHPAGVTGLGYHPDGDSIIGLEPRGRNLSSSPISRLFTVGPNPADLRYYAMDPAGRSGPSTGALDVEAKAGTVVYAPVTGVITAIRPDPMLPDANVIEIKSDSDPNLRVYVSLVKKIDSGVGVYSSVTAGKTTLGLVSDSARVLHPQLSSYTGNPGNHVTVSALGTN